MSLDLKVIGAGLGRTGTTSLKEALSVLLGGACFHMLEYKARPELMSGWLALTREVPMRTAPRQPLAIAESRWEDLMPGYVACVDEPACFYWRQLAEAFPDARVILSLRDTDSWFESSRHVIEHFEEEASDPAGMSDERRAFHEFTDGLYPNFREGFCEATEKAMFEEHNRQVLEFAERDAGFKQRLLVWRVEEGWAPICHALGVGIPDLPFPHRNKRAEYHGY